MVGISTLMVIGAASLGAAVATRGLIYRSFEKGGAGGTRQTGSRAQRKRGKERLLRSISTLGESAPVKAEKAGAMRAKLAQAGLHMELSTWRGLQIASLAAGVLLAAAALVQGPSTGHLLAAALAAGLGAAAPQLLLSSLTRDRQAHIRKSMASNLELLSITVRSGYPLERGLKLVANSSSGPLSEEFKQVDADINLLGMSMERSLGRMAQRCNVPEVSAFCSALIQASRQGTSITRVLDSQARLARAEHYAALQEKVNKLPAKLVAPIFGIMMLIIVIALVPPVYQTVLLFAGSYTGTGTEAASLFG